MDYIKNIKHYQLYLSKETNFIIMIIYKTTLIVSKTRGKGLNQ